MATLGRIRGIKIIISNSLLVLLFFYSIFGALDIALAAFTVVLLHETGHVIAARCMNISVESIELFPFGGVARMRLNRFFTAGRETFVAMAGPAVNLILAVLIWFLCTFFNCRASYLDFAFRASVIIGLFNMVPVLPLDGGRAVRAFLAKFIGYFSATRVTAQAGQCLAGALFFFGLWQVYCHWINFFWLCTAAYFFYAAKKEKESAFLNFISFLTNKEKEIKTGGLVPGEILVVDRDVMLMKILERLAPQKYLVIYVVGSRGEILGIISEQVLISSALTINLDISVGDILKHPLFRL